MLEITILKVEHQGTEEARKLLPYIQECDVFGPESAFLLEAEAAYDEKNWRDTIKADISRTQFLKFCSDMIEKTERNPGIKAYKLKTYDYLFSEKKSIWHPERYYEDERNSILASKEESRKLDTLSFKSLWEDKKDDFFDYTWKSFAIQFAQTTQRDQHIAKQLAFAETHIKNLYPQLAEKEKLKYSLFVGLAHEPEKHMDIPVNAIDLSTSLMIPLKRMYKAVLGEDRSDESKRHTVIWLYRTFFKQRGPSQDQMEQMSLTDLIALLKKDLRPQ